MRFIQCFYIERMGDMKKDKCVHEIHIECDKKIYSSEKIQEAIQKGIAIGNSILKTTHINGQCHELNSISPETWKSEVFCEAIIDLTSVEFSVPHLDIGGSGESIIYKMSSNEITIIDNNIDEMIYDKRVNMIDMDARCMNFREESFKTGTIFYTLMYIEDSSIDKVFNEVYRVLEKGGKLLIWDVNINDIANECIIVPVKVLNGKQIERATYSSNAITEIRNINYYKSKLNLVGFDNINIEAYGSRIFISASK